MIQSMTGYGASTLGSSNYRVTSELKSLNSKFLEITLKLPRVYMKYETELRGLLTKRLQRGKIVALFNVELLAEDRRGLNINQALAKGYVNELRSLKQNLELPGDVDLPFLVSLPEVIPTEVLQEDEEEWSLIRSSIEEACDRLIQSRKDEGQALDKDLKLRISNLTQILTEVEKLAPLRLDGIRARIDRSLDEIRQKVADLDTNRFEQELIFYIEKLDINEEIVRLKQHFDYFEQLRSAESSNGKKLQFLAQEIGREINTIGSKANNANIQRLVVEMKDQLEKIKEQVLNIL